LSGETRGPSNRRKIGRFSQSRFHRIGVHLTGPRFLIWKTPYASVKLGASNAPTARARLIITRIGQKISLLVLVKKKIVLVDVSLEIYTNHFGRLRIVGSLTA
jgi:hypothetical protein